MDSQCREECCLNTAYSSDLEMRSEPITREGKLRKSAKRIAVETDIKKVQSAVHSKGGDAVTSWSCSSKLLTINNYHTVIRWLQLRKADWWIKCCRCLVGRPPLWREAEDKPNNLKTTEPQQNVLWGNTWHWTGCVCEGEVYNSEHVKHMNWFTRIHTLYCSSQRHLLTE